MHDAFSTYRLTLIFSGSKLINYQGTHLILGFCNSVLVVY